MIISLLYLVLDLVYYIMKRHLLVLVVHLSNEFCVVKKSKGTSIEMFHFLNVFLQRMSQF